MNSFIQQNQQSFLNRLEDVADKVFSKSKRFLPHISRVCLTLTFIEDSYRLLTQWSDQNEYLKSFWGFFSIFSQIFILFNIIGQSVGSGMVIVRYKVKFGVAILMSTVVLQTLGYGILNHTFIMRSAALFGSLILLLAESNEKVKSVLAGLPETGINKPKEYMLLCGRVLTILIFLSLIHWGGSVFYIVQALANLALIIMVAIGYKTKLCSFILVCWLVITNFWYNGFWNYMENEVVWDILKYDFFQTWSVIGGLLMIVNYGPGGVSVDDYKKDW